MKCKINQGHCIVQLEILYPIPGIGVCEDDRTHHDNLCFTDCDSDHTCDIGYDCTRYIYIYIIDT